MTDNISDTDVSEILSRFDEENDSYHRYAVDKALSHRQELTPHLIKILETLADNPLIYSLERHDGHIYAAALLAHFGETSAHLPLIRAFSLSKELTDELWGDMITESLSVMLYRTSGGSTDAIKELAVNQTADQFVRGAAVNALSLMVSFQPSLRDEVVRFLQEALISEAPDDVNESYYLSNLAITICDLHPGESMEILRRAHEAGMIDWQFLSLEEIEEANAMTLEAALERLHSRVSAMMPADIHDYMPWHTAPDWNKSAFPVGNSKKKEKRKTRRVKHKYTTGKKPGKKRRRIALTVGNALGWRVVRQLTCWRNRWNIRAAVSALHA